MREITQAAHTVFKTQYQIVWVTRFCRKILAEGVAESTDCPAFDINSAKDARFRERV